VTGVDGQRYTSDQATIWRWRTAFQHDFAARMDWTIADPPHANHNPVAIVNGQSGKAPLVIDARVGEPVTLDAAGTRDPDGDSLRYSWVFYSEAGTGIPGHPVSTAPRTPPPADAGGIPSAPAGGPPQPPERVTLTGETTPRTTVTPRVPGTAHVILVVEDEGQPSLTSYRRIILRIAGN
jgi:hypothetical protein